MERRPLGNVVIGTDFAHHSHDALARAAWLPLGLGCRITLVHALPRGLSPAIEAKVRAGAAALMRLAQATVAVERERCGRPSVDISVVLEPGRPAELLEEQARHGRAELVVIGRGMRHGPREQLLGSNAERIVRGCGVSVLVVRNTPTGDYRQPLVAVDLSEVSAPAVEWAIRLADSGLRALDVIHAFDAPYLTLLREGGMGDLDVERFARDSEARAGDQLSSWLAQLPHPGVAVKGTLRLGPAARILREECVTRVADLLVVGSHGRSGLSRLLLGSVAEAVMRSATADVLVMR